MGDAERFGIAGRIRSIEATVSLPGSGGHGWHVHIHALVFVERGGLGNALIESLDETLAGGGPLVHFDRESFGKVAFGDRVFSRFSDAVERRGLCAPRWEGFDIREVRDGGAEFIGSYLAKGIYDVARKLGAEIASGGQTKDPRTLRNVTPFEVLRMCASDVGTQHFGIRTPRHWEVVEAGDGWGVVDLDTAELSAITAPGLWPLWHEWEQVSRGRHQLDWSRRRKDNSAAADLWDVALEARGEAATDEELAARELFGEDLGSISRGQWYGRMVWRPSWLVGALVAAEQSGASGVKSYLADRGVTLQDPQPARHE